MWMNQYKKTFEVLTNSIKDKLYAITMMGILYYEINEDACKHNYNGNA